MAFGYREATAEEMAQSTDLLVPSAELLPDQRAFINAYLKCGTIRGAVKLSKVHHLRHYNWCREDNNYQAIFAQAESVMLEEDIAKIRSRGIDGYDYEVLGKDGEVRKLKRYDSILAMFYIKAKDQRFKDSHKGDTININVKDADKVNFDFGSFRSLLK